MGRAAVCIDIGSIWLMGEEGYTGDYEDEYAGESYDEYDENYDSAYDEYAGEEPEDIEFVETEEE